MVLTMKACALPVSFVISLHIIFCKQILWVAHSLELQRVAAGILEEHGPLLTCLTLEAKVRLDDELDTRLAHPDCELYAGTRRRGDTKGVGLSVPRMISRTLDHGT